MRISNLESYLVLNTDSIGKAFSKLNENKSSIVFVVDAYGKLLGSLTDGDVRRALLRDAAFSLDIPVSDFVNESCVFIREGASNSEVKGLFSERVKVIPVVNELMRVQGLLTPKDKGFNIGMTTLSYSAPVFIIAEIGNNHNGDIARAFRLIDYAKESGANCVKFQMRDMKALYGKDYGRASSHDLGAEYVFDLLNKFQLDNSVLFRAFDYCMAVGVIPLCTPWDLTSLEALESYGIEAYKVASADLTNFELLREVCRTNKPMICSTGMSTEREIIESVELMSEQGGNFALLHCNSTYPTSFKDVNLSYLTRLREIGAGSLVGYSGHERGFEVPLAAVSLGAKIIEKHLTEDRSMEGNDHRVSLLPYEFAQMVEMIRNIEVALGDPGERSLSQGERMNREVLAKNIVAANPLKSGMFLRPEDLEVRSPGNGLQPNRMAELLKLPLKRDFEPGELFYEEDLKPVEIARRAYKFKRKYGIPVRFHDVMELSEGTSCDLFEFHLSYRDLDCNFDQIFGSSFDGKSLVVHSPELFEGDHILDLASNDSSYRAASIRELRRVINLSLKLGNYFNVYEPIKIICNVGGATDEGFLHQNNLTEKYQKVRAALDELQHERVMLLPQTMPPFPWHFGGQRFHNLFVKAQEIRDFCEDSGFRICLDVSHSKLASNYFNFSFKEFLSIVGPYVEHMHLSDARGTDGEGLQIGEGDIDFVELSSEMAAFSSASFIPEVWQGHKNRGAGFWVALERLEKYQF